MELLKVLAIAYLVGINIFGFTLLRIQKKESIFETEATASAGKQRKKEDKHEEVRAESGDGALAHERENAAETDGSGEKANAEQAQQERHSEDASKPDKPAEEDLSKEQVKKQLKKDKSKKRVRDIFILFVAALGGALAVYVGMFMMRYKLKNMFLMIFNPVFIGLHAYLAVYLFQNYVVVA